MIIEAKFLKSAAAADDLPLTVGVLKLAYDTGAAAALILEPELGGQRESD